nr:hypothetical protein [Bryobacter sp.]
LTASPLAAEVTRVYTLDRTDVLAGKSFGKPGPYERIVAKAHFAVSPGTIANSTIRDLKLAPRNAQGQVEFTADVYVLKPRDPAKGNGTVLFEVSNRGGKSLLSLFNLAASAADPRTEAHFGDGLLMEEGYTLVWVGWQWDVRAGEGRLRLDAPVAMENGKPIRGQVRSEFVPDSLVKTMAISSPYVVLAGEPASLTVRDSATGRRAVVPTAQWKLNEARTAVEMAAGFQPGRIYELIYTAENSPVAGLGMAAVRDFVSFLKYGTDGLSVLGDQRRFIKRALAYGSSQSGRWLRTFLYEGQNEDEKGRKVFDGIWANVAGAGRGSFNHRFSQPSRSAGAHINTMYPADIFPFSDVPQSEPVTGESDALLIRVRPAAMPKIFYTNTSGEYWNRAASLVHTSPDGQLDAPLPPQTRLYVVSAAQHGSARAPKVQRDARYPTNPVEFRPLYRALLGAMHEWVLEGKAPPDSQYPLIAEKQLVPPARFQFPKVPGVTPPRYPALAYSLDFGPRFKDEGIIEKEPPQVRGPFAVLVPQVDSDGIDLGGIRMPAVQVPLGAATGWNLRSAAAGAPERLVANTGSWFPLAATRAQRESSKDPRPSIEERYSSREDYLQRVRKAAGELAGRRLLLQRDVEFILEHAGQLWDKTLAQR